MLNEGNLLYPIDQDVINLLGVGPVASLLQVQVFEIEVSPNESISHIF